MSISFHEVSVGSYLQMLNGLTDVLQHGREHVVAAGGNPDDLLNAKLAPDMFPLAGQWLVVEAQSIGVIEGLQTGKWSPPREKTPPATYAALEKAVSDTRAKLSAMTPADVNALESATCELNIGSAMKFSGKDFVLNFSLPNFFFHVTTMYGILRNNGAPLGKRLYLGGMKRS